MDESSSLYIFLDEMTETGARETSSALVHLYDRPVSNSKSINQLRGEGVLLDAIFEKKNRGNCSTSNESCYKKPPELTLESRASPQPIILFSGVCSFVYYKTW